MSERDLGQLSFADGLAAVPENAFLARVEALVDWSALEALLHPLRSGRMGAPGYPSMLLFRALLLQQWYALSDPSLEQRLGDSLSFRAFLGLPLEKAAPDHSTLWRFRERLADDDLAGRLFAAVEASLVAAGVVLKQGTLIDASLVPAAVNPPPVPKEPLPPDETGRPASKLVSHPLDGDAAWTKKEGRYTFGYKVHIAMDQTSRIVRRLIVTPANVGDSRVGDALICGDEKALYADKAYDSNARRRLLEERAIRDRIAKRADRWNVPSRWFNRRNAIISRRRAPIESIFAQMKTVYGFARARYRGIARNTTALSLAFTAMNLKRWVKLAPA